MACPLVLEAQNVTPKLHRTERLPGCCPRLGTGGQSGKKQTAGSDGSPSRTIPVRMSLQPLDALAAPCPQPEMVSADICAAHTMQTNGLCNAHSAVAPLVAPQTTPSTAVKPSLDQLDQPLAGVAQPHSTKDSRRLLLPVTALFHQQGAEAHRTVASPASPSRASEAPSCHVKRVRQGAKRRGRGVSVASRPQKCPKLGKKSDGQRQTTIVEHFATRKSTRTCAVEAKKQQELVVHKMIKCRVEDGLVVVTEVNKGLGVRASRHFKKGDFVCEYYGDLIGPKEAATREQFYATDPKFGCYMYYFAHNYKQWCVDATTSTSMGRLINHGRLKSNLSTRVVVVDSSPHLCFFARVDIGPGDELLYDYGDRRKEALLVYPWLAE